MKTNKNGSTDLFGAKSKVNVLGTLMTCEELDILRRSLTRAYEERFPHNPEFVSRINDMLFSDFDPSEWKLWDYYTIRKNERYFNHEV